MTRVLVSAASKHGATKEIADAIGARLAADLGRAAVDVRAPEDVESLDEYTGVVLGSAVYIGHWLPSAVKFAHTNESALRDRQVWLFSSGPIGEPPKPVEDPTDVAELMRVTGARGHATFPGRLDRATLRLSEKVIVKALRVRPGDHRDWVRIDEWAGSIAVALRVPTD